MYRGRHAQTHMARTYEMSERETISSIDHERAEQQAAAADSLDTSPLVRSPMIRLHAPLLFILLTRSNVDSNGVAKRFRVHVRIRIGPT